MSEQTVTPEQLTELRNLQTTFNALLREYGELHLNKRILESDIQATESQFNDVETARQTIITRLQTEFGNIKGVNLETGEIEKN